MNTSPRRVVSGDLYYGDNLDILRRYINDIVIALADNETTVKQVNASPWAEGVS